MNDIQIGEKRTCLIFYGLLEQPIRVNEIKRRVDGICQKSQTQCLRILNATVLSDDKSWTRRQ